ncbi:hypothetical protein NQ318_005526 [Aromia moschata]|uniref:Uncharacterized protein n=1 Tax=Aromia moschata TaxID=1265417 RepID=A0AAV8Y3U2_9CUCU|nr:hypothetical protein NQ318_005526 [Aromia moschata]
MSTEQLVIVIKAKQTIHNTARKIAKEVGVFLGMEFDADALDIIAELTYKKLLLYGMPKRSTITVDDVKLLVRRNDSLKELVEAKVELINSIKLPESVSNKRKRKTANWLVKE